jgi:hypothetical protein
MPLGLNVITWRVPGPMRIEDAFKAENRRETRSRYTVRIFCASQRGNTLKKWWENGVIGYGQWDFHISEVSSFWGLASAVAVAFPSPRLSTDSASGNLEHVFILMFFSNSPEFHRQLILSYCFWRRQVPLSWRSSHGDVASYSSLRNRGHRWNSKHFKKYDTDHIERISWERRERIKERFHKKTETQFIQMKIRVRWQDNQGKAEYSWATWKRKVRRNLKSEWRTGVKVRSNDFSQRTTRVYLQFTIRESWLEIKILNGISGEFEC